MWMGPRGSVELTMSLEPGDPRAGFAFPIAGTTRLRLFPLTVKTAGEDYVVVRRDTGRMVHTSHVGVEAIGLLRRGLTLDAVRGAVGRTHGCDPADVDLTPLIESLVAADFVAAIDGRQLSVQPRSFRDRLHAAFVTTVRAPLISAMIRHAPVELTLRVLIGRRSGLRRYYIERFLLALLPPRKLASWLRRRSSVAGTDHLDRALAGRNGAILCAFHVTSYSMIPFVLAARGYAQTVLMLAGDEAASQIRRRLRELRQAGHDYPIEIASVGFGMRALVRALRRGETVLLLFDATAAQDHDHLDMPFLGGTLRVARGVGWLAWHTAAPILPVSVQSQRGGRCHVAIHPPLPMESGSRESDCVAHVLRRLTAVLENDVQASPEHWLKWKDYRPGGSPCDT
jgi:lauroyl/myristoyl acyltransferase